MKPEGLCVSFTVSFLLVKASPPRGSSWRRPSGKCWPRAPWCVDQSRHPLALVERTDPIALVEAHRVRSKLEEYY